MEGSDIAAWASAAAAIASAIAAWRSWQTSERNIKLAQYQERYAIYTDAEQFLGAWMRQGYPDMEKAHLILGAINRADFILPQVKSHLWEVWTNAVTADEAHFLHMHSGDVAESADALKLKNKLLQDSYGRLRDVFLPHLRVEG